jgi:hypothetical protein
MDERISDILGVLEEEIGLYRDLVGHAAKKSALLAEGRIEAVLESNKIEETFVIKLQFLEIELKRLCSEIGRNLGIECEEITLTELANKLEQPESREISRQIARFRKIAKELKAVTQRNLMLAEKSIVYSRGLLRLIFNATSPYQRTGLFGSIPSMQPTFSRRA